MGWQSQKKSEKRREKKERNNGKKTFIVLPDSKSSTIELVARLASESHAKNLHRNLQAICVIDLNQKLVECDPIG